MNPCPSCWGRPHQGPLFEIILDGTKNPHLYYLASPEVNLPKEVRIYRVDVSVNPSARPFYHFLSRCSKKVNIVVSSASLNFEDRELQILLALEDL